MWNISFKPFGGRAYRGSKIKMLVDLVWRGQSLRQISPSPEKISPSPEKKKQLVPVQAKLNGVSVKSL